MFSAAKIRKKSNFGFAEDTFLYLCTMKTTLFLVRHGETVDNAAHIMQGQTQGELNEKGMRQARELRDKLESEQLDAIVASDLYRSVQTAEILAEPHHLNVEKTPLLRERDWGSFTGRFIPSLKGETWPDDIESLDALKARAARFLDFVRSEYEGKTVLAVGHGIINKAIQAVFYGKQMPEVERMQNCDVRILNL